MMSVVLSPDAVDVVTASKCIVRKLESGTKYWFRAAAIGSGAQRLERPGGQDGSVKRQSRTKA
ncbi:MAG TPA: hypothetical protein VF708_08055 [Pyrinomonadaceae bacterium]|jgi:hypothetical protein